MTLSFFFSKLNILSLLSESSCHMGSTPFAVLVELVWEFSSHVLLRLECSLAKDQGWILFCTIATFCSIIRILLIVIFNNILLIILLRVLDSSS